MIFLHCTQTLNAMCFQYRAASSSIYDFSLGTFTTIKQKHWKMAKVHIAFAVASYLDVQLNFRPSRILLIDVFQLFICFPFPSASNINRTYSSASSVWEVKYLLTFSEIPNKLFSYLHSFPFKLKGAPLNFARLGLHTMHTPWSRWAAPSILDL